MASKDPFSIDNINGIAKQDKKRLLAAEIYSVKDLVVRGAMNVSEDTGIPMHACKRMCSSARSRLEELGIINRTFSTPTYQEIERISLGSANLDSLLGGKGVHTEAITQFFGESNSGKTQICHSLCVTVQHGKDQGGLAGKTLYMDTESTFTQERIGQIAKARGIDRSDAIKNIILVKAMSSTEEEHYLERAGSIIDQHKNVKLLIVDSVTGLYRAEYIGRAALPVLPERQQRLYRHMRMLRRISEIIPMLGMNSIISGATFLLCWTNKQWFSFGRNLPDYSPLKQSIR